MTLRYEWITIAKVQDKYSEIKKPFNQKPDSVMVIRGETLLFVLVSEVRRVPGVKKGEKQTAKWEN